MQIFTAKFQLLEVLQEDRHIRAGSKIPVFKENALKIAHFMFILAI